MGKKMIDIRGDLYDTWDIKMVQKLVEFNDNTDDFDYFVLLNKDDTLSTINGVKIQCIDERDMIELLQDIKIKLEEGGAEFI